MRIQGSTGVSPLRCAPVEMTGLLCGAVEGELMEAVGGLYGRVRGEGAGVGLEG